MLQQPGSGQKPGAWLAGGTPAHVNLCVQSLEKGQGGREEGKEGEREGVIVDQPGLPGIQMKQ